MYGPVASLSVLIGASIFGNDQDEEALTILVGGTITGFVAGLIAYFITPRVEYSLFVLKSIYLIFTTLLPLGYFTAPIVGFEVLDNYPLSYYGTIILDLVIGSFILWIPLSCILICCLACCITSIVGSFMQEIEEEEARRRGLGRAATYDTVRNINLPLDDHSVTYDELKRILQDSGGQQYV
jgi:hypothetical protein